MSSDENNRRLTANQILSARQVFIKNLFVPIIGDFISQVLEVVEANRQPIGSR